MCSIMAWCGKDYQERAFVEALDQTISRGPDDRRIMETKGGLLGFRRLSIMGLTPEGMQPFELNNANLRFQKDQETADGQGLFLQQ